MSKAVILTWVSKGETIIENCALIEETDHIYVIEGGEEIKGLQTILFGEGYLLFEDDHGIFGIDPRQVVNIEVLE